MYDRLKYWLGAEPFLGIFVLAFAVPLTALFVYAVVYGFIEHPETVAGFAGLWCVSALLAYLATRTSARTGKALTRASRVTIAFGIVILFLWDDFIPWRGFNSSMIVSLFFSAVFVVWMVRAAEREDRGGHLPDYRVRLD